MVGLKKLRVAYTPDSDDVFNFYAWQHERVALDVPNWQAEFHCDHITALNRAAQEGTHDVIAVSSAAYPLVADRYRILTVGNSVGRNFGPVLVSRRFTRTSELQGKRVAVAGIPTTGSTLALMYCPDARFIEMHYDRIIDAILRDELDAGVLIHEELLLFQENGLHCVLDLGKAWCDDTGLPLPVGLNLVRKDLGLGMARHVAGACQRSLLWALAHADEVYAYASRFGRGRARAHVEMFSNQDTLCLPADVRQALRVMFDRVSALGIGPTLPAFELIDP